MKHLILLLFCLGISPLAYTQSPVMEDVTHKFIHYIDPIGMVLIESIQPGMTVYGLSKKYNVSIDSIFGVNPDLDPTAIPLGYPVNIPIYVHAITFEPPDVPDQSIPVCYRVQPKETLYRISKVYLGVSPELVTSLNPRTDQTLSVGQVLHLGWYSPQDNTYSPAKPTTPSLEDTASHVPRDYTKEYKNEGKTIREQKGLAVWKPGSMQSQYYVLHPTAKVGSYMEITNPMLHRTLTAKVAGNIPPGLYQSHVGLVVSPSVARALGVLDQQFFARWRFVE